MSLTLVSPPCAAGFPCVIPTGLTVGASVRLTVTYGGFEAESDLLEKLYHRGLQGEVIA